MPVTSYRMESERHVVSQDIYYYLWLLIFLSATPMLLHAARGKLTLGPFFGLAGVYSMMLWQLLQTGWWVNFNAFNFNAGLTLFIPSILLGTLLATAFDGLQTTKSYIVMVATTCVAAWLFSIFRQALAIHVPLPYLIILSNREHFAIIAGLFSAQLLGVSVFQLIRKINYQLSLPLSLLISITGWLVCYSFINFGFRMGWANIRNESVTFMVSGIPGMAMAVIYQIFLSSRDVVLPGRNWNSLFFIELKPSSVHPQDEGDAIINRNKVISEIQFLNRKLKANLALMEYHMENAAYGIVITNGHGIIQRVNKPALKMLSENSPNGMSIEDLLSRVFGTTVTLQKCIAKIGARWRSVTDGSSIPSWYELQITPLKEGDTSAATGYYLLIQDVTDAVNNETRVLVKNRVRDLNQAGRVVSHDFSNLLIGAEAQLKKIREFTSDSASLEAIQCLSQAMGHARAMLKQIGTTSQFGAPRLCSEKIDDIITQSVNICRAAAEEAGVHIKYDSGCSWLIECDSSQIIRVVTNLLRNSIRASVSGSNITITVDKRGNSIETVIADEGVGMTETEIKMAFEPGFSSKGEGKGGLGLAISYLMVDAHGGHLDLRRGASGKGVCAAICLPELRDGMELGEFAGKNVIVASNQPDKIQDIITDMEVKYRCVVAEAHSEDEVICLINEEKWWEVLLIAGDGLDIETIKSSLQRPLITKNLVFRT